MMATQKAKSPAATGLNAANQKSQLEFNDAELIAQLAKRGHHVQRLQKNGYLASQWGMTMHCPDFAALEKFARQVGIRDV